MRDLSCQCHILVLEHSNKLNMEHSNKLDMIIIWWPCAHNLKWSSWYWKGLTRWRIWWSGLLSRCIRSQCAWVSCWWPDWPLWLIIISHEHGPLVILLNMPRKANAHKAYSGKNIASNRPWNGHTYRGITNSKGRGTVSTKSRAKVNWRIG